MLQAKELWSKLGDIPINDNDEIETGFLHFDAGSDKVEVWQWFEQRFGCSVAEDLMGLRRS